jgi:predicted nucleic acid-binding Zn ribbon protein
MRKSQTQKIDNIVRECLSEMHIDKKLKEVRLISQWESIVGRTVSSRTNKIYIRNRTLFLFVNSSVLKSELLMMRQEIIDKLNEIADEKLIDQIIIR